MADKNERPVVEEPAAKAQKTEECWKKPELTEDHKKLAQLVGEWKASIVCVPVPGQPEMESDAKIVYSSHFGGFLIQGDWEIYNKGTTELQMKGRETLSVHKGVVTATWADEYSTQLCISKGKIESDKIITTGSMDSCMGGEQEYRSTVDLHSGLFTMHKHGPNDKSFSHLEMKVDKKKV